MRAIELMQQHLAEFQEKQKQQAAAEQSNKPKTPQQQKAARALEKMARAVKARAKKHLSMWDRINNLPEEENNF